MREDDIRPRHILNEYLRLSARDAVTYFSDRNIFEDRPCPGCACADAASTFEKGGFTFATCRACGTLYATPVPPAGALTDFYRSSPSSDYWADVFIPSVAEARRAAVFAPRAQQVLAIVRDAMDGPCTLVDVGAGHGLFLEELARLAPEVRAKAVEPGSNLAQRLRAAGIKVLEAMAEDAAINAAWCSSADVVTCFEVIEHVTDAAALLSALRALVRVGGLVIVSGLTCDGFDIRVLGAHAKAVSPPHHLTFLSLCGVEALLARVGLEPVRVFTPGKLDVDILRNTLSGDPAIAVDGFARFIALDADAALRDAFQEFLARNRLSSHMWIVARRAAA